MGLMEKRLMTFMASQRVENDNMNRKVYRVKAGQVSHTRHTTH